MVERLGDERAGTWLDDAGAEGEAVAAFVSLAAELAACGAPAALVGAAWAAAADEVRHTRAAARWAAAHARDPVLASHHARIAADEARHAALGGGSCAGR